MLSQPFSRSTALFRNAAQDNAQSFALPLAVPFSANCANCDCFNSGVDVEAKRREHTFGPQGSTIRVASVATQPGRCYEADLTNTSFPCPVVGAIAGFEP